MLCFCEGPMFVAGLVLLILGKFHPYGFQDLRGRPARILGLVLMLPAVFPIAGVLLGISTVAIEPTSVFLTVMRVLEIVVFVGVLIAAAIMLFRKREIPEPQASPPAVWTVEEAAEYLRVSPETILQLIESGDLEARKIGDQYRLDREQVVDLIKQQEEPPARQPKDRPHSHGPPSPDNTKPDQ